MKASEVFPKAAQKAGVKYLGLTRRFSNHLVGYFETDSGEIVKTYAHSSVKTVVEMIGLNIKEGAYLDNPDTIRNHLA